MKLILQGLLNVSRLGDINYITEDDVELLDSFNETEYDLLYADILDAFNVNLNENPNGNLVSFDGVVYSYAEGAYIANKLAGRLMELGVDSGECVSFLVNRSELYMFCVLGVLSMGGVYVPLDL